MIEDHEKVNMRVFHGKVPSKSSPAKSAPAKGYPAANANPGRVKVRNKVFISRVKVRNKKSLARFARSINTWLNPSCVKVRNKHLSPV